MTNLSTVSRVTNTKAASNEPENYFLSLIRQKRSLFIHTAGKEGIHNAKRRGQVMRRTDRTAFGIIAGVAY